jgi:hypothetical protein
VSPCAGALGVLFLSVIATGLLRWKCGDLELGGWKVQLVVLVESRVERARVGFSVVGFCERDSGCCGSGPDVQGASMDDDEDGGTTSCSKSCCCCCCW